VPSAIVTLSRFPLVSTIVPPGIGCRRLAPITSEPSEKKEGVEIMAKTPILGNLDLRMLEVIVDQVKARPTQVLRLASLGDVR